MTLYRTDEYGIKNYKTRYLFILGMLMNTSIILVMAEVCWLFEEGAVEANVASYGQAVWLMTMAASTIGFGDVYPVTIGGKLVTASMFYVGVGMMGFLGGLIASKILGWSDTNVKNRELRKQNAEILDFIKTLK